MSRRKGFLGGRNGMRRYAWDGTTPERKRKEERAWGEAYREY